MVHITWKDFENVGLCVGTIVKAEDADAKNPSYRLLVDLGPLGVKKSIAQITRLYAKEELPGKQVLCVTNFPPKQIGTEISEVLTTGFVLGDGVVLASPERAVPNGSRLS